MKQMLAGLSLILALSSDEMQDAYDSYRNIESALTQFEFQGVGIDLKGKKVSYPLKESVLYFEIDRDYAGKPLYRLTYRISSENVQAYLKRLQRASQR